MTVQDWIALFNEQSGSMMTFWTVYVVVVGLVVGFVAQKETLGSVRWLLAGAFILFALANGFPMFRAQATLKAIHGQLPCEVREMFTIWPPCVVALVHLVMDVLVALFIVRWDKGFALGESSSKI